MDMGYEVIFTITGMVLVFLILILLMLIIRLEGKLFEARSGSKAESAPAPKAAAPAVPAAAPVQAAPAVQVEQGVPAEVVAAIMAAIYAMGDGKYTLKAVRRGANNWGRAGMNDATAPF